MSKIESEEILLSWKEKSEINAIVYINFIMQGRIDRFYIRELKESGVNLSIIPKSISEEEYTTMNYKGIFEYDLEEAFNDPLFKNKLLITAYKAVQKDYSYLAKDIATRKLDYKYTESDMFLNRINELYQSIRYYEEAPELSGSNG